MKILHTDKDETPAIELPAEEFLQKNAEKPAPTTERVYMPSNTSPEPTKKNNGWVWVLVIVAIVALVGAIIYYSKLKEKNQQ